MSIWIVLACVFIATTIGLLLCMFLLWRRSKNATPPLPTVFVNLPLPSPSGRTTSALSMDETQNEDIEGQNTHWSHVLKKDMPEEITAASPKRGGSIEEAPKPEKHSLVLFEAPPAYEKGSSNSSRVVSMSIPTGDLTGMESAGNTPMVARPLIKKSEIPKEELETSLSYTKKKEEGSGSGANSGANSAANSAEKIEKGSAESTEPPKLSSEKVEDVKVSSDHKVECEEQICEIESADKKSSPKKGETASRRTRRLRNKTLVEPLKIPSQSQIKTDSTTQQGSSMEAISENVHIRSQREGSINDDDAGRTPRVESPPQGTNGSMMTSFTPNSGTTTTTCTLNNDTNKKDKNVNNNNIKNIGK